MHRTYRVITSAGNDYTIRDDQFSWLRMLDIIAIIAL